MSKAVVATVGTLPAQATPEAPAPVVISSEVLGRTTPADVSDPELALGRVTIVPGATIPVHHHPGTRIGAVVQGMLTYTVFTVPLVIYLSTLFPTGAPRAIVDATPTP